MIDLIMDLNKLITLHSKDKSIELPLINLLRICFVQLKEIIKEYQKIDPNIEKFWKWILKEKLKVPEGGAILS